jgi:hypothetical protein
VKSRTNAPGAMLNVASAVSLFLLITAAWQLSSPQQYWQSLPLAPFGGSLRASEIAHGLIFEWHSSDRSAATQAHFARVILGFCYIERYFISNTNARIVTDRWLTVPWQVCLITTALTPLLAVALWIRWFIFGGKHEPGHCRNCGYDLRATPDRCPECGQVVSALSSAHGASFPAQSIAAAAISGDEPAADDISHRSRK